MSELVAVRHEQHIPTDENAAEGNRLVTPLLDVIVVCVSAAFPYQRKCLR